MRICLCHHKTPETGSISKQAELHKKILEENGYKVTVIGTKTLTPLKFTSFVKMVTCLKKSDILHVHACSWWGFLPAIYGVIASQITEKKVIITYHGGAFKEFYNKYHKIIKPFLKRIDKITVPSGFLKEIFNSHGYNNINVIYNIIDDNFIKYGTQGIKKSIKPYFIVTRSLEPLYNVKNAIKAFKIIKSNYLDAKLFIVGDGSQKDELQQLTKDNKIRDVFFLGRIPNDEMPEYYSKADIAISPSNYDNMPLSIIEAQACGLCVISTNVGGIPFIINNMKNGILVPQDDYYSIAEKVGFLLTHQVIGLKIIENAKNGVLKKYSYNNVKKGILLLYKSLFIKEM